MTNAPSVSAKPANECAIAPSHGASFHSDVALTNLFATHVALIHSERTVIWQRYSSLLLAHSVALGFMSRVSDWRLLLVMSLAGGCLSFFWYQITAHGYRLFHAQLEAASRFTWTSLDACLNPVCVVLGALPPAKPQRPASSPNGAAENPEATAPGALGARLKNDPIRMYANAVIVVFAFAYAVGAVLAVLFAWHIIEKPAAMSAAG